MSVLRFFQTIFVAVLFVIGMSISESYAATINAASCSLAHVSAAISASSAEDTVTVPAGNCTWNTKLTMTKGINLMGGIGGTTTITNGHGGFIIQYNPSDWSANHAFRLSGFTFDMDNSGHGIGLGVDYKKAPFTVQDKVRVDNNIFINGLAGFNRHAIWNYNTFYGVVYNNTFTDMDYAIKNDNAGYSPNDKWWETSPQSIFVSGTNNYMYYEDNTFTVSSAGGVSSNLVFECQFSGRYAARYNTIVTDVPSYSLFEMHGHQGSGMDSCFGAEVYGNNIITDNETQWLFKTRGGRSFIYLNSVETTGSATNYVDDSVVSCPAFNPSEQMVNNTYMFNSRKNLNGDFIAVQSQSSTLTCDGRSNRPELGVDVFDNATTPSVTCGTEGNKPGSCTENAGYWATDQSCSNLTGMVGKDPSTPISGIFYKCDDSNNWVPFYTPYTYPHPLRSGSFKTPRLPVNLHGSQNQQ